MLLGMTTQAFPVLEQLERPAPRQETVIERVASSRKTHDVLVKALGTIGFSALWGLCAGSAKPLMALANAASFSPTGTVIVELTRDHERAVLRVSDDGPGIAAEDLPHVFERFYTTRRHDKGTGLGLALVRAVVEAHGGSVAVTSKPGRGATLEASFDALP